MCLKPTTLRVAAVIGWTLVLALGRQFHAFDAARESENPTQQSVCVDAAGPQEIPLHRSGVKASSPAPAHY